MADYAAETANSTAGGVITERTGSASSDTVPAGSIVLWRNTGAGTHVVTLTTNNTAGGLAVADRTISIAAGTNQASRIDWAWGDASNRVAVAIDGTATEVKFSVLGGV